ncbi:cytochrome P450 [Streptomyces sp. NPDC046182]|uniref:cytochrome P450 n=1 Tax=Streptomyces sp. NPDC046182 TaxID=3154601 RepID=UPI00340FF30B
MTAARTVGTGAEPRTGRCAAPGADAPAHARPTAEPDAIATSDGAAEGPRPGTDSATHARTITQPDANATPDGAPDGPRPGTDAPDANATPGRAADGPRPGTDSAALRDAARPDTNAAPRRPGTDAPTHTPATAEPDANATPGGAAGGPCPRRDVRGSGAPGATPDRLAALRDARRRDRRVYTRSHPLLFALLAAVRRRPVARAGRAVLVSGTEEYREALTRIPLDRAAAGTTGGVARELSGGGSLFDQEGGNHRDTRRAVAGDLGAAGVERLRPVWRTVLARRLAPLAAGRPVDLVPLARELAGATVRALLDTTAHPSALAEAAADAAAAAVRDHLPGPRLPGTARAAAKATARLEALLADGSATPTALRAMIAVAAVNTTVAAVPRAAAWCADGGLWEQAADDRLRPALVDELLRVTAPSPLLPRVAAADAVLGGCPVRAGDRLVLVARHAVGADREPPDAHRPAPVAVARLVFGAGPHACPGARLALAQLDDVLAALAPYRPTVVASRVDRRAALPGWRRLTVRATTATRPLTESSA